MTKQIPEESLSAAPIRLFLLKSLLAIGGVVAALLLAEGAVRVVNPQFLRLTVRENVDGITVLRAAVRGRWFSPGEYDVRATINSQRFRASKEYARAPDPGVLRIVALGDSFTFGTGAEDDETYPYYLERELNAGSMLAPVEVLNSGIHGSGPGSQAAWFERWIRRFSPDVVVLTVFANDVSDEAAGSLFEIDDQGQVRLRERSQSASAEGEIANLKRLVFMVPGYDWLCQHSHLTNLIRSAGTLLLFKRRSEKYRALGASDAPPLSAEARALRLIHGEIQWLNQAVLESGGRLCVLLVPDRESLLDGEAARESSEQTRALRETVHAACAEQAIPFLDLTESFRLRAERRGASSLYFVRDFHLRPEGNRFMAHVAANWLQETFAAPRPYPALHSIASPTQR